MVVQRIRTRILAERWVLDAVRRRPEVQSLRRSLERQRSKRIVATEGSVDAALDRIVRDAIASSTEQGRSPQAES